MCWVTAKQVTGGAVQLILSGMTPEACGSAQISATRLVLANALKIDPTAIQLQCGRPIIAFNL